MLDKRTNILFSNELWHNLLTLARRSNTSVGDLISKAVEKTYFQDNKETITKAFETILSTRKSQKNIDYQELIAYGRKR